MAEISFVGNVGSTDLRFTQTGRAVLSISVAEQHRKRDGNAWVDDGAPTWWRVTAWERQAETLAETLGKGDRVLVTGTVRSREWEKDGEKRTSYDVTARHVAVIPKAGQTSQAPAGGAAGDPWATGQSFSDSAPPF